MRNKDVTERLLNGSFSSEDLKVPFAKLPLKTEEAFKEYWSLPLVKKAVDRYESKDINKSELASFFSFYELALTGKAGEKDFVSKEDNLTKKIATYDIVSVIGLLSLADTEYFDGNIQDYVKKLGTDDDIYHHPDAYSGTYCLGEEHDSKGIITVFLFHESDSKSLAFSCDDKKISLEEVTKTYMEVKEEDLFHSFKNS